MKNKTYTLSHKIIKKISNSERVAGFDEVGAGCCCGDLVIAGVILDPNNPVQGLRDSKKINPKRREQLYYEIKEKALQYTIIKIPPKKIDEINILQARMLGFFLAAQDLNMDYALIDGNKVPKKMPCMCDSVVKGDQLVDCISAASILAKHERDNDIIKLSKTTPYNLFSLEKHKGYGTKDHFNALFKYGYIEGFHRETFKPIPQLKMENKILKIIK